ncbi:aldo/keto reductase [Halovulum sp. GXIMD14794]
MQTLPRTDVSVSPICLGTTKIGATLSQDESFELLDMLVELGGNFVDTAAVYSDWIQGIERGCSEKTLGRWRAARNPQGFVIATKGGHPDPETRKPRLDATSLRHDAAQSCERLGLDCLDLWYLHRDDPARPVEDILGPVIEMISEGLISNYGLSNWRSERLAEAWRCAGDNGWPFPVASQVEWNFAALATDDGSDLVAMDDTMIAWHRETGCAAIPYSAQAMGYFDRLESGTLKGRKAERYHSPLNRRIGAMLSELATKVDATPTETLVALLRHSPFPVIPVVGCRNVEQLRSSFRAVDLVLPRKDVAQIRGIAMSGLSET